MAELFEIAKTWFFKLGESYGVNPIVFGSIYIGAIPFFTVSVTWLIRNYRLNRSLVLPSMSTVFFFISAYLYLIIAGENVPWWVYSVIAVMLAYGTWSVWRKIRKKIKVIRQEEKPTKS